jgi:hypothetical protein
MCQTTNGGNRFYHLKNKRLEDDKHSRTVTVADIRPEEGSSDDDIPIVSTLPAAKA